MTARSDYSPPPTGGPNDATAYLRWEAMCDEIDRLRNELAGDPEVDLDEMVIEACEMKAT